MMAGIKGKDTRPELIIRKALFAKGYRYRLHVRTLPGKPDIVLQKYSAILFINGCFWHGHECHLFKLPKSNVEFWQAKINRNKDLDMQALCSLRAMGWRVGVLWECGLRGKTKINFDNLIGCVEEWLHSAEPHLIIHGI